MTDARRPPLRLGRDAPWGQRTCQFGLDRPLCSAPATRHFLWLNDSRASAACDEHAAYIHSRDTTATPFDEHAHGPNCGMPGCHWRFPDDDETEGYCYFPSIDDDSLAMEIPVLTTTSSHLVPTSSQHRGTTSELDLVPRPHPHRGTRSNWSPKPHHTNTPIRSSPGRGQKEAHQ